MWTNSNIKLRTRTKGEPKCNPGSIKKNKIGGARPAKSNRKKGKGAKIIKNMNNIIFCKSNEKNSLKPTRTTPVLLFL
jgi:hypothetical protein